MFLSFSDNAFRLLLPPALAEELIDEMCAAHRLDVRRGPWEAQDVMDSVLITWENGQNEKLGIWIVDVQYDHIPYTHDVMVGPSLSAWSPTGKLATWPARFLYRMPVPVDIRDPAARCG